MITFEPCANYIKKNGWAQVYLRVVKGRATDYMKTQYMVNKKDIGKDGMIRDFFVIAELAPTIKGYYEKLRTFNYEGNTVKQIIKFLESGNDSSTISFTGYYKQYVAQMKLSGRTDPAANYQSAFNSLIKYAGTDSLMFADITSKLLNGWIDSLMHFKRVKNLYPTCISTVFTSGRNEYNDYEKGMIVINNDPFKYVKIPSNDEAEKRSVDKDVIVKILNADTSDVWHVIQTVRAKDVCMMVFCLAGINVVDLYKMKKSNRVGNKLIYNRSKTEKKRSDSARMEITIPDRILHLFDKYKGSGESLLNFSETVSTSKNFLKTVDNGLEELSRMVGVPKVSTYTFRHTWATIAEVNLKYTEEQIGFCLNHTSAHRTTRLYIRKDFSVVDDINRRVIAYLFGEERKIMKFSFKNQDYQLVSRYGSQ